MSMYKHTAPERTSIRAKWGMEHGMLVGEVEQAIKLANRIGRFGTRECNGDPHLRNPDPTNKSENARLWGLYRDQAIELLNAHLARFGFQELKLNGLYPTLRKSGRDYYLPYDN